MNAVVFLLFKPQGEGANQAGLTPTTMDLGRIAELILKADPLFKIGMDSCLVNHVVRNTRITPKQKLTLDTCEGARMSAYISPSMKMMPCSFANKHTGVQIDKKNTIQNIWQKSKPFKEYRKALKKKAFICPAGF